MRVSGTCTPLPRPHSPGAGTTHWCQAQQQCPHISGDTVGPCQSGNAPHAKAAPRKHEALCLMGRRGQGSFAHHPTNCCTFPTHISVGGSNGLCTAHEAPQSEKGAQTFKPLSRRNRHSKKMLLAVEGQHTTPATLFSQPVTTHLDSIRKKKKKKNTPEN